VGQARGGAIPSRWPRSTTHREEGPLYTVGQVFGTLRLQGSPNEGFNLVVDDSTCTTLSVMRQPTDWRWVDWILSGAIWRFALVEYACSCGM
jgi:hypothetical protein